MQRFSDLIERDLLALAISSEEEDAGTERRRHADQEGVPGLVRGEHRREHRRQRRDRAVHQSHETGLTATVAGVVVELLAIAWIRWRYMDTPPLSAVAKVMLCGALVLATGILINSA